MQNIITFLNGKKTFIAAAGIILTALASFLGGDLTPIQLVQQIFAGLGLVGLRLGVTPK